MAYCTIEEVKAIAQNQEMNDVTLQMLLDPVSQAIDKHCRRTFTTTTESRKFYGTGNEKLRLDKELYSLTSITLGNGTVLDGDDVLLEPVSGPPYLWIRITTGNHVFGYSSEVAPSVTVTGKWGYSATPPANVKLAAMLWVIELYNTADIMGLSGVNGGGAGYSLAEALKEPPPRIQSLGLPRRVRVEGVSKDG